MKKILFFFLASTSLLLMGCGSTTTMTTTSTDDAARQNQDFGPYTGQETIIHQTKDMADFQITLNKVIIGTTNFGKYEDGYASLIVSGYTYKWIIGDFTITSKIATADLSSLQFGIGWQTDGAGEIFNSAVYSGQLSTGAQKFGFYQDGYMMPLAKGETKNIKVIIPLTLSVSGHINYFFDIGDENHLTDDKRVFVEFPLGQSLNN